MITFIICSISPEKIQNLEQNIKYTIGKIEYEMIAFDNRQTKYGITKVYNLCAEKARFDYLCFIHEDIAFHSLNWGETIVNQLKKPHCGVIGFSGSQIKSKAFSSVHSIPALCVSNYIQRFPHCKKSYINSLDIKLDYAPCITLDGLCLFVRKQVWREHKFDEVILTGFHGYDLDFTLQVAEHYQNYVCNRVLLEHFSQGVFKKDWASTTIRLHQEKWENRLPLSVLQLSDQKMKEYEHEALYRFIRLLFETDYSFGKVFRCIMLYGRLTHYKEHFCTLLLKLVGIRIFHVDI